MRPRRHWFLRPLTPSARGRAGFARNERGAVAVEFAILALPFFALIYALLETSIVFLAGQILDSAVNDTSRKLRTGQAQTASWSIDEFRSEMCERLYGMFDCNEVKIAVSTVAGFSNAAINITPIDPDCRTDETKCDWTITESYTPGIGSQVVLVQAYYKWPILLNLPGVSLATNADGTKTLSAVRVFQNEPFS
jgi:Flp pilus assembly protein TadG